ncbi:uncharacterized protein LOC128856441 [Anastrepha ludens]|uniref:uncharacterized protein LOC128856441 n=1 Tax=Anastrepha ludens TaxID=28586 RepID=UPI0023AED9D6|nr:uncharacterized protein LOC128856441 [Anastrepha ludens]
MYGGSCDHSDPSSVESELIVLLERLKNAHSNLKAADEAMKVFVKQDDFTKECDTIIEYDDKAVTTLAQLEHFIRVNFKTRAEASNNSYEGAGQDAATEGNSGYSALVGKAAASIAGFTPTEKCYSEAIILLQEKYGNNEKIVEKFVQKLMNIRTVQSTADIYGLRQLYNEVTSTMRSLVAFHISSAQYDIMVKSILLKSIPTTLRVQFYRSFERNAACSTILNSSIDAVKESISNGTENDQLNKLLKFLKTEIEALEKAQMSERDKKCNVKERRETRFRDGGTAAGLFVGNRQNYQCVICKTNTHTTKSCKSDLPVEEKKLILRREGRCFRCTNRNHNSKYCNAQWVKCDRCSGRHISTMCERQQRSDKERNEKQPKKAITNAADATTLNAIELKETGIFLQTAKAIISEVNSGHSVMSRIIMDNGSQRTYISEKLAEVLKLPTCGFENVQIIAFGDKKAKKATQLKSVEISLRSRYNDKVQKIKAIVVPTICANILPLPKFKNKQFRNIKIELADGINVLIGQDYYWIFNYGEIERLQENLVAIKTFFGWTIQGSCGEKCNTVACNCVESVEESSEKYFDIEKFWSLESIGIKSCQLQQSNPLEGTVFKISEVNGRYVVCLPWKNLNEKLNSNKEIAEQRLYSLTNKLLRANNKLIEYDIALRDLIQNGIAEQVNDSNSEIVYYMPHKPVYRDDKITTKTRIVFDASSSEPGVLSLNDHLNAGDNLVADLLKTLLRFRSHKIAITADIEKAFLQIEVAENDRDALRFLWYERTPVCKIRLPKIVEYHMTRVTFGVTSSPFLLAATLRHHLNSSQQEYGVICDKLKQCFYVDDLVISERSLEEAKLMYLKSKEIMAKARFNLRKWNTNDPELSAFFLTYNNEQAISQKVLDINWTTANDEISVSIESISEYLMNLRPTKRNVMKAMAKIYDPLGMLGPFTVRIKLILQNIWKENLEWDEALSGDNMNDFQHWQEEIKALHNFNMRRCLATESDSQYEVHIFADASPKAYGAVAYVRQLTAAGIITTNFICSKNRITKAMTHPWRSRGSSDKLQYNKEVYEEMVHRILKRTPYHTPQ